MFNYFVVWISFGMLPQLLLAEGTIVCSEEETPPRPKPIAGIVAQLTECLVDCSRMTFIKKVQLNDNRTIRLTDSTEGDNGEYCWSDIKCLIGESFQHAYVVLPVDPTVEHEQLEVKSTVPTATKLHVHSSPTIIAESCGLLYDVTQHFISAATARTSFCVRLVNPEGVVRESFARCPAYLATIWQRAPNQSNQQGGG